ncbi:class I SAM-dependent methyltransferase [Prochlorococcus marinus]|uniref:Uncharacterized protein n=1 Tax=Prochlorococcus marinus (strain AS9601) TaxID=146891 RepID=A2BS69_PROMS|nr:methyltransferase domain-containing protein [Prochlorococcus marinus]ABM70630.1 Hypothetical protein A9601_13461 [Prochlorococcus marinus str. AS9601]
MAKSYNDEYFLKRSKNRNKLAYENDFKFIKNNINDISNILDFGCGEMLFTRFLLKLTSQVYVYDPSPTIQNLFEYKKQFKQYNEDQQYDAICLRGVIQHLPTPFKTISNLINHNLKSGGYLIFTASPNTYSPYYILNKTLPPLVENLNYWVPSTVELRKVMNNYNMQHLKTQYPYLNSGYANPIQDHYKFILNLLGMRSKYPFWFSIFNSIYIKK